jgi:hypothetical protein
VNNKLQRKQKCGSRKSWSRKRIAELQCSQRQRAIQADYFSMSNSVQLGMNVRSIVSVPEAGVTIGALVESFVWIEAVAFGVGVDCFELAAGSTRMTDIMPLSS